MLEIVVRQLVFFGVAFVIVYFVYYAAVIKRPKKLEKFVKGTEAQILKKFGNLNLEKHEPKKLAKTIALINALAIALIFGIVTLIQNFWLAVGAGFILAIVMILIIYKIVAKSLYRKEVKQNV